jgi:chaperonin GroES
LRPVHAVIIMTSTTCATCKQPISADVDDWAAKADGTAWHVDCLSFTTERTRPMTTIRPLHDRIIVRRLAAEEKSPGGIIIPDAAKEKPVEAEVVAVGNGKLLEDGTVHPLAVKPGDRVLFGKYSGTDIKIDGVEHLIMREEDVLGVLIEG